MISDVLTSARGSTNQILRLGEVVDITLQSGGLHAFLTWKPFSASAFRMLRSMKSSGLHFNTIIDGGANRGQFARAATETYPESQIIAFEPLPDVADRLRENVRDRPQITVMQSALGSEDGTIDFYRHRRRIDGNQPAPGRSEEQGDGDALEVPVIRLDNALQQILMRPPILLKLDLQGFEIEALSGASEALSKMDYVVLETSFIPMYAGEPDFIEILDYMRNAGFSFLRPIDVIRNGRGAIVQMQALFAQSFAHAA